MPSASMRAVSGGWHSPNLQMVIERDKKQQVIPIAIGTALRLPATRYGQLVKLMIIVLTKYYDIMKTKQLTTVLALLIISYSTFSQPYPYRNCSVVTIVIQTTQETIDRLVPKPFTANNEGIMIFDMSELNIEGYFKYNELIIYIPVELYGEKGYYVPTLYVDHFNALIRGRELWGFNKILANINIQKTSTEISYKVKVFNQDLLDLKYNVGKQIQIPESPTCLFFNFKRIPSIEDGSFEINQITSVPLTNFHYLTYQKGTAQVTLNDIKEGGLGLIPILKIMDASFSTRDFDLGYGKIEIDYNFKK